MIFQPCSETWANRSATRWSGSTRIAIGSVDIYMPTIAPTSPSPAGRPLWAMPKVMSERPEQRCRKAAQAA